MTVCWERPFINGNHVRQCDGLSCCSAGKRTVRAVSFIAERAPDKETTTGDVKDSSRWIEEHSEFTVIRRTLLCPRRLALEAVVDRRNPKPPCWEQVRGRS